MAKSRQYAELFDGRDLLEQALVSQGIDLCALVAATTVWANPEVFEYLKAHNGYGAYFPNTRRAKPPEVRGMIVDGTRLDDNTYANHAIKYAVGLKRLVVAMEACHVWPGTTYIATCHTVIANLVLMPTSLAGLSDHNDAVISALKYRSYELYGWYPPDEQQPPRPERYSYNWREPEPMTPAIMWSLKHRKGGAAPEPAGPATVSLAARGFLPVGTTS